MQFKVGDRVEVLKPAAGVRTPDLNYVGPGTIEDVDEASAKVRVDANEKAWWYALGDIRHAVEEIEIHPTPSITVGTQVRLTGVVSQVSGDDVIVALAKDGHNTLIATYSHFIEVIRQPFKRGEVVYIKGSAENEPPAVILNDEQNGLVDVTDCETGTTYKGEDAASYERRP